MSDSHKAALAILEDVDRMVKSLTSIDTTDLKEASKQLAEIGQIFDSIPVESNQLKQCGPGIALYKTKLTMAKSGVRKAFSGILDFSKDNSIEVRPCMYDTPTLWIAANRLHMEPVILSDFAMILSKRIISELVKYKQVSFASGETRWSFLPKEASVVDLPSIFEALLSAISFVKNNIFVALGADRVFLEFGRRIWPSLAKQFQPTQALCDLEAALVQLGLIDTAKVALEYTRSLTSDKERDDSKILAEIRARLLGDVNRKIGKIEKANGPLAQFKFVPNMVSVEVGRIPNTYFRNPATRELIPAIVALFCLLRQTQYVDPKGINARMMGIFFNDTVFLSVGLAMLKREKHESVDAEIAMLKLAGQKSTAAFLNSVVLRANERLVAFRDKSWDLGLSTKAQYDQADKDINDSLTQVLACINEWRAIMMDPEIVAVWTTMMIDRIVREMNKVAVFTAKAAISKGTNKNCGLWQIYVKFLNSIERIIPPEITDHMTSVKVGRKIKTALSAGPTDIKKLTDPMVTDEILFGINKAGFEALLHVNPLLHDESKESKTRLTEKFMAAANDQAPTLN